MDLYTTSFTVPRLSTSSLRLSASPLPGSYPLPPSTSSSHVPLPPTSSSGASVRNSTNSAPGSSGHDDKLWDRVRKLAEEVTAREGCLVTVTREHPGADLSLSSNGDGGEGLLGGTSVWNFHLSGSYQSVMSARGAVLRDFPRELRVGLKVARTDVLETPLAPLSALKPEVRRRLEEIVSDTKAEISVISVEPSGHGVPGGQLLATVNAREKDATEAASSEVPNATDASAAGAKTHSASENPDSSGDRTPSLRSSGTTAVNSSQVIHGLETERMCEIVITGRLESVELAKLRVLVFLDELSGLHAEVCEIDYKLHSILAARKRCVIQSIQEQTATNIYFPTPLVGIYDPPQSGLNHVGYRNMGLHGALSSQDTGMPSVSNAGYGYPTGVGVNYGYPAGNNLHPSMNHGQGFQPNRQGPFGPHIQGGSNYGGAWTLGPQMPGAAGQHYPGQHAAGGAYGRQPSGPVYDPHQHVQYPYQPQPLGFDPNAARGLPYSGNPSPGYNQFTNGIPPPLSTQHTGMSTMTGYQSIPGGPNPDEGLGGSAVPYVGPHSDSAQPAFRGDQQFGSHMTPPHIQNGRGAPYGRIGGGSGQRGRMGVGPGPGGRGGIHSAHVPPHMRNGRPDMGINMTMEGSNVGLGAPGGYPHIPHPGLSVHSGEQGSLGRANQIWITGEFYGVQRARDMLLNVAMQKSKLVISRDTAILPRKLDWLLMERLDEVKAIMSDNGTYLQVPPVGSQASLMTVFGDHRVNIERTIRSLMALACQFYVASFWLLPMAFDALMPPSTINPAGMQPVLKRISHATGAEIVFKSNCFEMHGLEQQVRAAVLMVMELDVIHSFAHEIRFQIELANEHREFIAGKKNGKINKVMKMAGVRIKFETLNDYNFLVDIAGTGAGALQGLSFLQEELPAEISFHVPESYHKKIIGVAGKNIQRIMKQYGVYVKFSNAEEFAALGGYADNEDNVVARTPAKNAVSLESLRQSVMEMVNPKDQDYTTQAVSIPRRHHRSLVGEKSIFIHDIERKTNSIIRLPYKEAASDIVTIFGPESQLPVASAMLLDHVPFEADLHVPPSAELTRLVTASDFVVFTEQVKRDHQISIAPSAKFGKGDEAIFKFRCQRSNIDFLGTARDALEEFLGQHSIQLYPAHAQRKSDTFVDAFTHFNSKLLSMRHTSAEPEAETEVIAPPTARPRPKSTDVKALFDGHATDGLGGFKVTEDPGVTGFAGPLSYDPQRMSDLWQPTQHSAQPHTESDAASKRDSDPIIQDKMRQATMGPGVPLGHSPQSHGVRGMAARTQSLDITSLNFSRALSSTGGPFGPMPPSPAAMAESPNTASGGQFFPSSTMSGPPGSIHSGGKGQEARYSSGIDKITHGIGNIHV